MAPKVTGPTSDVRIPPGFDLLTDGPASLWINRRIGLYLEICLNPNDPQSCVYVLEEDDGEAFYPSLGSPIRTQDWSTVLARILAYKFAQALREQLTPTDWRAMLRKNYGIGPGSCASHDYLDANILMAGAFIEVAGHDLDVDSEDDANLWSAAWDFATTNLLTETPDEGTVQ
jgi:hypothetical protein